MLGSPKVPLLLPVTVCPVPIAMESTPVILIPRPSAVELAASTSLLAPRAIAPSPIADEFAPIAIALLPSDKLS